VHGEDMVSRFHSIEIEGLFGDGDETIEFPDLDDPIRILYGVNGSGKTTILKIIQNTYRWNPLELIKLPFDSITFNKNTRRKFDEEMYFYNLRLNDSETKNLEKEFDSKEPEEIYQHIESEIEKIKLDWGDKQERNADSDIRKECSRLKSIIGIYFLKRHLQYIKSNDLHPLAYVAEWGDGLITGLDPQDRNTEEFTFSDLDLRLSGEFDYNASLKVEKVHNPLQYIANPDEDRMVEVECGCFLKITLEHEPRLDFENGKTETLLRALHKLNEFSPDSGYKFSELFVPTHPTHVIRMPDLYDYWDLDWDRIEEEMPDYMIERSVSNKNMLHSNLVREVNIQNQQGRFIDVHDFLIYHLPYSLVTHAKPREGEIDKQFSKRNRPPDELVDFFDYSKTATSYSPTKHYYISLPKVVDISTEREIGNDYFYKVNKYIKNESRILVHSLLDVGVDKLESYDTLNSEDVEMIKTRLKERGIDLEKIMPKRSSFEQLGKGKKYDVSLVWQKINKLLSVITELSPSEKRNLRVNYIFGDLRPKGSLQRDNDYTVGGVDLKPLVSVIENLVSLSEIEMFTRMINSKFEEIKIDICSGNIYSGRDKLSFTDLSSGERQKFQIFTSIGMQIVNTSNNILITIDEPEISLHLSWQRQFVDDIISFIGELTSKYRLSYNEEDPLDQIVSLIISTHSPTLLANHFHRGQKLGEDDIDG
jgi:hypothetical protein